MYTFRKRKPRHKFPIHVLLEKLVARRWIDPDTGCWIWTGAKYRRGYGSMWNGAKCTNVARISAEIHLGLTATDPRFVCHHCDVPACFNPAHLFLGTQQDNWNDCRQKGRAYQLPPRTTDQLGEKNPNAKLTWEKVHRIRALWHVPGWSQRRIAREFGVSQATVSLVLINAIWKSEEALH